MKIEGLWIPLVTPFKGGKIDYNSYKGLIGHYTRKAISGLIPLGTTGESPTISEDEFEEIIDKTTEFNSNRVPVFIGLGGNNTAKIVSHLKIVEKYKIQGILSVSPFYSKPDQRGIYEHYKRISESTALNILIYNIPYRTGRNIENDTIYKLAELNNIIGLKDSCGNIEQSMQLLFNRPHKDFSILTGEDVHFYTMLLLGGDGGILASAHLQTDIFREVYQSIKENNHLSALSKWKVLAEFIPLLFEEPNPSPVKYCLQKLGLIKSSETRLPLTEITDHLREKLDKFMDHRLHSNSKIIS